LGTLAEADTIGDVTGFFVGTEDESLENGKGLRKGLGLVL
jgi:hypothetical protein